MKKIAFLFGGRSAEHEVSVSSAATLLPRLIQNGHDVCPIFIDKDGSLYRLDDPTVLMEGRDLHAHLSPLVLCYGGASLTLESGDGTAFVPSLFFSVLHGTYGEDGAWQGLFTLSEIPFVGCDVLGSALSMNKAVAKEIVTFYGIPTAKWLTARELSESIVLSIEKAFPYPVFVKPVDQGSSIGASRADSRTELWHALSLALSQSTEALIEEYIEAKEISVAVLEKDGNVRLSLPGEILSDGFFDYERKYGKENTLLCPADISEEDAAHITYLAHLCFRALRCRHMARVDFFLTADGRILFNEINTIPGLTEHSLYPQLLAETGEDVLSLLEGEVST